MNSPKIDVVKEGCQLLLEIQATLCTYLKRQNTEQSSDRNPNKIFVIPITSTLLQKKKKILHQET